MRISRLGPFAAFLLGLGLLACSNDPTGPTLASNPVPDFGLTDVNATSATSGQVVSPRDYLGQASAWYFGHST